MFPLEEGFYFATKLGVVFNLQKRKTMTQQYYSTWIHVSIHWAIMSAAKRIALKSYMEKNGLS